MSTRTFQIGVRYHSPFVRSFLILSIRLRSSLRFTKMSSNRLKPKVGIVFSQTDKFSGESLNLASYFCGLLSSSGYSEIYMIGYQSDGMPGEVYPRRIKYIPRGETSPKEVPVSEHKTRHYSNFSPNLFPPFSTGIRCHFRSFPCAPGLPFNSLDSQLK